MTLQAGGAWLLGGLLLSAQLAAHAAPLSWDSPEPRSRASKIRVHPRGNLWATEIVSPRLDPGKQAAQLAAGYLDSFQLCCPLRVRKSRGHFMGKKSLETLSPFLSRTVPHISLRDQRRQLSHHLPRLLLLRKLLGMSLSGPAPHPQYRRLLVQMVQK